MFSTKTWLMDHTLKLDAHNLQPWMTDYAAVHVNLKLISSLNKKFLPLHEQKKTLLQIKNFCIKNFDLCVEKRSSLSYELKKCSI